MNFDPALLNILNQYTAEKFTEILYKNNIIYKGRVIKAHKKVNDITFLSYLINIELFFSHDAEGILLNELFLKVSRQDVKQVDNTREILFYNKISAEMKKPPIPRVLHTSYNEQLKTSFILMVNLSKTHFNLHSNYPMYPNLKQCCRVVENIAMIHTYWWNHELLSTEEFKGSKNKTLNTEDIINMYRSFEDNMSEWFNGDIKKAYKKILSKPELLFYGDDKNFTLVHEDAHFGNILYPKDENDSVMIIDWSDWKTGKAMDDLAYMIALRYFPNQRQVIEKSLIEVHNKIVADSGIDYTLEESIYDYKRAVIKNLFLPIYQWYIKIPENIWYYNFERVFMAFKDLSCEELI